MLVSYCASDKVLEVHINASYLSESKVRSRTGGHLFLLSYTVDPKDNGAVLSILQIIKAVMSSAAEAELAALFINDREAIPARMALETMGHPQPRTPMQTDNSTACGVVNSNIMPRRTKAQDMHFWWLRDREAQGQF